MIGFSETLNGPVCHCRATDTQIPLTRAVRLVPPQMHPMPNNIDTHASFQTLYGDIMIMMTRRKSRIVLSQMSITYGRPSRECQSHHRQGKLLSLARAWVNELMHVAQQTGRSL